MTSKVLNFVFFQAGWFSCVLGAANGVPWLGVLVVGLVVAIHLVLSAQPRQEFRLVLSAAALGAVLDTLPVAAGWLSYPNGMPVAGLAPYWILAMWALFATTLNLSMAWIKRSLALASVMGAVFGPLSYIAGQRLGAVTFNDFNTAVTALAVAWALAMPLLVIAARRFNGAGLTGFGRLRRIAPGADTR